MLVEQVSSVGEVSRANVVAHVDPRLFNTCEDTGATAVYKRMLTASLDLSRECVAVRILGGEHISRLERARLTVICTDESLGSRLVISSTR